MPVGFIRWIKDRFDLTVECIRRHYLNEASPLSDTLERYSDYFRLFGDFGGYVEFFLLQDLVTHDFSAVKFFSPFDDFNSSPVPGTLTRTWTIGRSQSALSRHAISGFKAGEHGWTSWLTTTPQPDRSSASVRPRSFGRRITS